MINIGDSRALTVLRTIIADENSPNRIDAIRAVGHSAKRRDALPVLSIALNSSDIQIRLEAYEMLDRLNSPAISRKAVANGALNWILTGRML